MQMQAQHRKCYGWCHLMDKVTQVSARYDKRPCWWAETSQTRKRMRVRARAMIAWSDMGETWQQHENSLGRFPLTFFDILNTLWFGFRETGSPVCVVVNLSFCSNNSAGTRPGSEELVRDSVDNLLRVSVINKRFSIRIYLNVCVFLHPSRVQLVITEQYSVHRSSTLYQ